jgi:hypothetical protein
MNIDRDSASLLAQVIIALLILIALEDRLSPKNIGRRKLRRKIGRLVEGCVAANVLSLGLCLFVAVTEIENTSISAVIAVCTIWLLAMVFVLLAAKFGHDDNASTSAIDR